MSSWQNLLFIIAVDENILANTHIDPGQVGQKDTTPQHPSGNISG